MTESGHDRDTLQYRVKVKELWKAYHKAQEANHCSGAVPMSCRFYQRAGRNTRRRPHLHLKTTVDTSVARVLVESGPTHEEDILDEDVEGKRDQEAEDDSEIRDACSQELFSTLEEASQSQLSDVGKAQTGEKAPLNDSAELESGQEELRSTFCMM
ncbi:hypothetical protein UY3_06090 [Chelonia mydas]|uniref:Uncharacterized protein n=1 Tax=Chelonia mydas TaxID=8469 RepID=M7BLU7_CHEMY|nr:hypothetical protein UY3_06090 [Chelonia mydas]